VDEFSRLECRLGIVPQPAGDHVDLKSISGECKSQRGNKFTCRSVVRVEVAIYKNRPAARIERLHRALLTTIKLRCVSEPAMPDRLFWQDWHDGERDHLTNAWGFKVMHYWVPPAGMTLKIGGGIGNLKHRLPDVISSDVQFGGLVYVRPKLRQALAPGVAS
jgi:hypothetical protein